MLRSTVIKTKYILSVLACILLALTAACGQLEEGTVTDREVVKEYTRSASEEVQSYGCGMRVNYEGKMKSDCWYGYHGEREYWDEVVPECLKITYGNDEDSDDLCVTSHEWEKYQVGDLLVAEQVTRGNTSPREIPGTRH